MLVIVEKSFELKKKNKRLLEEDFEAESKA